MKYINRPNAILLLEDGTAFYGKAIGKIGKTSGEICFNTGMTGYQEIFTDPSYYGQIIIMTTSHIGNYGVNDEDIESDNINIAGLVCKNFSNFYSRAGATSSIQEYFEKHSISGISDIDTRALVRYVRSKGAMNCIISSEELDPKVLMKEFEKIPSMSGLELSSFVSTKEPYFYGNPNAELKIAVLDLGVKKNILRCLAERNSYLKVFPHNTSFKEMQDWNPDAYMLSNGPGDPGAMDDVCETVKQILHSQKPTFGICLGHQLLARAVGLSTQKMHHGHRGVNHPILNLESGKGEITSQNHGFVVTKEDAEKHPDIDITHIHLNDNSLAGMRLKNGKAFSVQYHPESSAGPNDSRYLFDNFVQLIRKEKSLILN